MKYITYNTQTDDLQIFIAQDIFQADDDDAMEFNNVQLLGMRNINHPEYSGFNGKEEFFVYSEGGREISMNDFKVSNEMDSFFTNAMGKVADGILPKNYVSSLKAIFGEANPYGNN